VTTACNAVDACHTAACIPDGGCLQTPVANGTSCEDGNVCNGTDACQAGTCTHSGALTCTGDACHTAACSPTQGCVLTAVANGTSCNDANACNGTDACQAGTCTHSGAPNCDDSNLCTSDSCDPTTGCKHTAITCNDGYSCTVDTCSPSTGCVFTADDTKCTTTPACMLGFCSPGNGDPTTGCFFFADNSTCTASSCAYGYCDPTLGCSKVAPQDTCDDHSPGTVDTCNANTGCQHSAVPCAKAPIYEIGALSSDGGAEIIGLQVYATLDSTAGNSTSNQVATNCNSASTGYDQFFGVTILNYTSFHADTTTVLPDGGKTVFDSLLYLRDSTCGASAGAQLVCDDDFTGTQSSFDVNLNPGQYYLVLDGYSTSATGRYVLNMQIHDNDICAYAKDLGTGGTYTGDSSFMVNDYQSSASGMCVGKGGGGDAVFKVTAPAGKTKLHLSTLGSVADTVVYVRTGTCTGTELGCNDDAFDSHNNAKGLYSDLTVNVTAGTTYFVFVDSWAAGEGPFVLNATFQ
jgi:hypothetical protein